MKQYLELIYYHTVKKNVIVLKKLGRNIDEKKFIVFIGIFVILVITTLYAINLTIKGIIIAVFIYTGAFLYLPSILYENKIEKLENNIPQSLYIMILTLESGRSINEALEEVVRSNIKEVSNVFKKVLYLMEKQKISFEEAMTIVSNLYDSKVLKMLARIMIENRKYGGNLADSLRILAKTLEDFRLYKRQLLSVTASGLAVGFIILCGVIPAVAALLGAYLITISKMMGGGMSPIPPVKPSDISKGMEIIQIGTAMIGALFSIPIFGIKIGRMFIISSVTMTVGVFAYYLLLKVAPTMFT